MTSLVRPRTGMTLLELLVAIVVTGIALAAGYTALSTIIDRRMQARASVEQVTRAAAIRRTIIDWIQHGQLQLATSSAIPSEGMTDADLGLNGGGNDQLRFITTAPTPFRHDSTVVELYVNTPDALTYGVTNTTPGLVAMLTPSQSAITAMQQSSDYSNTGGSSGFNQSGGGAGTNSDLLNADNLEWGTVFVPLDSAVTGLRVDYLVRQITPGAPEQAPEWIPSSQWQTEHGNNMSIIAVRLTLLAQGRSPLAPILTPPIIVPVTLAI